MQSLTHYLEDISLVVGGQVQVAALKSWPWQVKMILQTDSILYVVAYILYV